MEKLTKKDIKGIALALQRATENLMEICSMMLRKERKAKKPKCKDEGNPEILM